MRYPPTLLLQSISIQQLQQQQEPEPKPQLTDLVRVDLHFFAFLFSLTILLIIRIFRSFHDKSLIREQSMPN